MSFQIRVALPTDKSFILSLASRFSDFDLPEWRAASEVDHTNRRLLQKALEQPEPGSAVFVAEAENGKMAGFIHLETEADFFDGRSHGYISFLGVDKAFEGQGVGQILLEQAETWTCQQGYALLTLYVFASNQRAQRLYQKAGFNPELIKYAKEIKQACPSDQCKTP
jgi:ribosomal protein S18 acetylase RimI-like enzyme